MTGEAPRDNVVPMATGQMGGPPRNGGRIDRIEQHLSEIDKRLVAVETKLENVATKEGIAQLENRVLTRLIWMMVAVYGTAVAVVIRSVFFGSS